MELTLEKIIGKHILVGITYFKENDEILKQTQIHGIIDRVEDKGIVILINETSQEYTIPLDLSAITVAPEGEYRLHSTGEVVVNPDLLTTWSVYYNSSMQ